jgi:hypothetical protein
MIKIFSDKKFLPAGFVCHMLVPFWGQQKEAGDPDADRFDQYIAEGNGFFQMAPLQDADIAVYPASPTHDPAAFRKFQEMTVPKPLVAFFNDDSDAVLEYRSGTMVFRTSFYKSTQRPTEFAIPGWSSDHGTLPARQWAPSPTVSFCGQVYPLDVRKAALDVLESDQRIAKRFIRRNQFWGGWIASGRRAETGQQVRREFLQNMADGDYILCARGGGNFSYRIYEAMMCGRIPLLVNTDCVLPYDFMVEWSRLFPIVDKADIPHIGDRLLAFHQSLSPEAFAARQRMMRMLWEEWISPTGFFSNLHRHFKGAGI